MFLVDDLRIELPWGVLYIGDDDPAHSADRDWDPVGDPYVDRCFVYLQACHEQHGPVLVRVADLSTAPPLGARWTGTIETPTRRLRIGDLLAERESRFITVESGRCRLSIFADPIESPDTVIVHVSTEDQHADRS